jgi:Holliday junction resolvase
MEHGRLMGKMSRTKGSVYERELVNFLKGYDLKAQRVPLSGATAYAKGDVEVKVHFRDAPLVGECKRRAALPEWIEKALGENDFLAMRADRSETLIVIRASMFAELLQ